MVYFGCFIFINVIKLINLLILYYFGKYFIILVLMMKWNWYVGYFFVSIFIVLYVYEGFLCLNLIGCRVNWLCFLIVSFSMCKWWYGLIGFLIVLWGGMYDGMNYILFNFKVCKILFVIIKCFKWGGLNVLFKILIFFNNFWFF